MTTDTLSSEKPSLVSKLIANGYIIYIVHNQKQEFSKSNLLARIKIRTSIDHWETVFEDYLRNCISAKNPLYIAEIVVASPAKDKSIVGPPVPKVNFDGNQIIVEIDNFEKGEDIEVTIQ